MDLQLFIAINIMAFSALIVVASVIQRAPGTASWAVANAAVVLAGAAGLLWARDAAGWIAGGAFLILIAAPTVLSQLAARASNAGNATRAAWFSTAVACLHPAARVLAAARRSRAIAADDRDGSERALTALMKRSAPDEQAVCRAVLAARNQDWSGVLAAAAAAPSRAVDMKALEIRAHGELGEIDAMFDAYRATRPRLDLGQAGSADLVVMAFAGREAAVEGLLKGPLKSLEADAQSYWRAAARLARSPQDAAAKTALADLAQSAARPVTRKAAAARLMAAPAAPLSLVASAEAAAIEQRLLTPRASRARALLDAPVTLGLLASYLVMFALEAYTGGTENIETLVDLGALWPPLVLERGEWWRLITAAFLHLGNLHLIANSSLLIVLGPMTERAIGKLKYLAVYLCGAAVSSFAVLMHMEYGSGGEGVLVGASGALFAIFGIETARRLKAWLGSRDVGDRRQILLLGAILALQFGIDLSVPEVSFTAHISGFLTGLLLGLMLRQVAKS